VRDSDFRYPGPKPRTKEAALLLLADSVEAAARSLDQPSPGQLRDTVERVVKGKVEDGQLGECDLTLRDLSAVIDSFARSLVSQYHRRVKYPEARA
jgi:membrane-associated HD superfamily phosphohydrolase